MIGGSMIKFYKNKLTDNIIYSLDDIIEDDYELLVANETDGAIEKHVPVYSINDNRIYVQVGEIEHPMDDNHYIMWIALVHDDKVNMVYLKPNEKPEALFDYKNNTIIYAYCNLHGLWKTVIK